MNISCIKDDGNIRFGHLDGRGWNLKRWYESRINLIRCCTTGNQLHLQMHINCVGKHKMQVCQSRYEFLKTSLFSMELKSDLVFFQVQSGKRTQIEDHLPSKGGVNQLVRFS